MCVGTEVVTVGCRAGASGETRDGVADTGDGGGGCGVVVSMGLRRGREATAARDRRDGWAWMAARAVRAVLAALVVVDRIGTGNSEWTRA